MDPSPSFTDILIDRLDAIRWEDLPQATRDSARRHLLDSVAAIVAGSNAATTLQAQAAIAAVRAEGRIASLGQARRFDMLDAAYIAGVAAHGLEFDDGFRPGSTHPGAVTVPAALAVGYDMAVSGKAVLEAIVAGYEAMTAVARVAHPAMRKRGFHPTATTGVFGAAATAAKMRGSDAATLRTALGLAASSAAGLFAFLDGGADVKRLHAGHAAREGVFAVLLAEQGIAGPPSAIDGRNGFFQAFADGAKPELSPQGGWGIDECYVKPYPCCRHIHPAVDALLAILDEEGLATEAVEAVDVVTYRIAAEHGAIGWPDFATSQLSFPFIMATALRRRAVLLEHFGDAARSDAATTDLCRLVTVRGDDAMDERYRTARPAKVTVTANGRRYERDVDDALGAPTIPLDAKGLELKFLDLVGSVGGPQAAQAWLAAWTDIESAPDIRPLIELGLGAGRSRSAVAPAQSA